LTCVIHDPQFLARSFSQDHVHAVRCDRQDSVLSHSLAARLKKQIHDRRGAAGTTAPLQLAYQNTSNQLHCEIASMNRPSVWKFRIGLDLT
jgi:hypothetical protein